jgi:hypothetical protein
VKLLPDAPAGTLSTAPQWPETAIPAFVFNMIVFESRLFERKSKAT